MVNKDEIPPIPGSYEAMSHTKTKAKPNLTCPILGCLIPLLLFFILSIIGAVVSQGENNGHVTSQTTSAQNKKSTHKSP